jgi:FkbM family methyltransferase
MRAPANANIKGVIQVGANDGGELETFCCVTRNLLLFEPVDEARQVLLNKVARLNHPSNIHVSDYVVSNVEADVEFFLGRESGNSSMFDLNPSRPQFHHKNVHAKKVKKRSITMDRFFQTHGDLLDAANFNYLYMDVQGAEHLVIEGAAETLKHIDYIWMEVSYAPIYFNTMLFYDMCMYCESLGYHLAYHEPSPHNQNQGDALYVKSNN